MSCPFVDADDWHSAGNKEKMSGGIPLTDEARQKIWWLSSHDQINHAIIGSATMVTIPPPRPLPVV